MKKPFLLFFIAFLLSCGGGNTVELSQKDTPPTVEIKPNAKDIPCKVTRVVDGDTFHCTINGDEITVRLIGVDTPEAVDNEKAKRDSERMGIPLEEMISMGKEATEFTKKLIPPGTTVKLETDVQITDKYGRVLAYAWLPDGRMLNEVLVREGYAQVYTIPPNVKYQELFLSAQREAREEGRGFWERISI